MCTWRNCTFLHSMWSSPFLLRLEPIVQVSRLEGLSRVDTTVFELQGSDQGIVAGSVSPDGNSLTVGAKCLCCAEVVFQPGSTSPWTETSSLLARKCLRSTEILYWPTGLRTPRRGSPHCWCQTPPLPRTVVPLQAPANLVFMTSQNFPYRQDGSRSRCRGIAQELGSRVSQATRSGRAEEGGWRTCRCRTMKLQGCGR